MKEGREISERLRRIDALKDRARSLEPLDGVEDMAFADYDRDWLVRYTYNSNAIEGSTLTLEDTSLVLEGEFVPPDSPARYVFAARGVADGMAYVREYAKEGRKLNEELIRRLHEVTALDLQPFARGTFRPARGVADGMAYVREYAKEGRKLNEELIRRLHEVTALDLQPFARGTFRPYGYLARITATRVKTADPLEIRDDLQVLVDVLNGSGAHPLLKAAGFHAMLENIHPFMDGNGRTGRQLLNFMLLKHGYRPVAIKYDAKRDYARGLEMLENIHPFMDGNGRTGRQLLNFMLLKHGYRPVAIKYDAKRDYARGLESWQVDGDSAAFCSVFPRLRGAGGTVVHRTGRGAAPGPGPRPFHP